MGTAEGARVVGAAVSADTNKFFPAIVPVPPATLERAGGESEARIAGEATCTAWKTASVLCRHVRQLLS